MKHNYTKKKYKKSHLEKNNKNTNDNINNSGFIFNSSIKDEEINPKWINQETNNIQDINKRFHKEILDYVDYITPKNNSLTERYQTFELFKKVVQKYRPDWKVILFGSFSQNISTIYSDLDFLILYEKKNSSHEYELKEMYNLMNFLKNEEYSNNLRLAKAKVPVLRGTCSTTGINVDISMNRENGHQAIEAIQKVLQKYKILRPSIIILKILLKKFNLNDPHSGGMNSYLLFHLVYFYFIQKLNEKNIGDNIDLNNYYKKENNYNLDNEKFINREENTPKKEDSDEDNNDESKNKQNIFINNKKDFNINYEMNIGNFIILFLKFYGYEFDYKKYGLSLNGNNCGTYYIKNERKDMKCSHTISAESIIERGKDVGENCYNYPIIIKLFKSAYNLIKSEKEKNICSILQSLGFPSI